MSQSYIDALKTERASLAERGKTDRFDAVDAELARLGEKPASAGPPAKRTATRKPPREV